ncbi:hypothetical protein [Leptospira santarosai]|uniref:hypothetical protein n=1 Tax=Leptospira santarosai TaxID=28183 RepID=UPI0002BDF882|nr:hypothetical protein [Leptospira santarosai]EMO21153.1 hypothetical protein LEP1GSC168_0136 [Leptospira santarosai str. HAI134]MDI7158048.1 hypothetical protein [Leptospira santarosai]
MDEPEWETVNEEELWKYVGWHLADKGIQSVLVGGAVVSIYSKGAYRSGDIDLVEPIVSKAKEIKSVMESIGFRKVSRHYVHLKCKHLFIEFVAKNQRFDMRQIKEWCIREGEPGRSAFEEFQALL